MFTRKRLLVVLVLVIIVGGVLGFVSYFFRGSASDVVIETQSVTGIDVTNERPFLVSDNVTGLSGCTDQSVLSQFSGYTLVTQINPDDTGYYDTYVYDLNLDLTSVLDKERKLQEKSNIEKETMSKVQTKIDEVSNQIVDPTGVLIDNKKYGLTSIDEYPLSGFDQYYRLVDTIDVECFLGSDEMFNYYDPVDTTIINNLDVFLGSILSGNINAKHFPSLCRRKMGCEVNAVEFALIYKSYKGGMLGLMAGGQDGLSINLFYIKNVGNKIYYLNGDRFMHVDVEDIDDLLVMYPSKLYDPTDYETVLKDLNCSTQDDCTKKFNTYIQDLLDGKESLPQYKSVYDKMITTIDYIFE